MRLISINVLDSSFFFYVAQIHYDLYIQSDIDDYLHCLQFSAILHNAAVNVLLDVLLQMFTSSLSMSSGSALYHKEMHVLM